jgi:hypothetical protein
MCDCFEPAGFGNPMTFTDTFEICNSNPRALYRHDAKFKHRAPDKTLADADSKYNKLGWKKSYFLGSNSFV